MSLLTIIHKICVILLVLQTSVAQDGGFWWKSKTTSQHPAEIEKASKTKSNIELIFGKHKHGRRITFVEDKVASAEIPLPATTTTKTEYSADFMYPDDYRLDTSPIDLSIPNPEEEQQGKYQVKRSTAKPEVHINFNVSPIKEEKRMDNPPASVNIQPSGSIVRTPEPSHNISFLQVNLVSQYNMDAGSKHRVVVHASPLLNIPIPVNNISPGNNIPQTAVNPRTNSGAQSHLAENKDAAQNTYYTRDENVHTHDYTMNNPAPTYPASNLYGYAASNPESQVSTYYTRTPDMRSHGYTATRPESRVPVYPTNYNDKLNMRESTDSTYNSNTQPYARDAKDQYSSVEPIISQSPYSHPMFQGLVDVKATQSSTTQPQYSSRYPYHINPQFVSYDHPMHNHGRSSFAHTTEHTPTYYGNSFSIRSAVNHPYFIQGNSYERSYPPAESHLLPEGVHPWAHTHHHHHHGRLGHRGVGHFRHQHEFMTTPQPISKSIENFVKNLGVFRTISEIGRVHLEGRLNFFNPDDKIAKNNVTEKHSITQSQGGKNGEQTNTTSSNPNAKTITEIIPTSISTTTYSPKIENDETNINTLNVTEYDDSDYTEIFGLEENTKQVHDDCVCVNYYLCADAHVVEMYGKRNLHFRSSSCPNDNQVCCKLLKSGTNKSEKPITDNSRHINKNNDNVREINLDHDNKTMYNLFAEVWPVQKNVNVETKTSTTETPVEDDGCLCVSYFLCEDGVIQTDGKGILDLRFSSCPDETEVCCKLPKKSTTPSSYHELSSDVNRNATDVVVGTDKEKWHNLFDEVGIENEEENMEVEPEVQTPVEDGSCVCVYYFLCEDGKVNTDGKGFLDLRFSSCPEDQVCCTLMKNNTNIEPNNSDDAIRKTTTEATHTPSSNKQLTRPTPVYINEPKVNNGDKVEESGDDGCECVYDYLCADGSINTEGKGLLDLRFASCPEENQVCCKKLK